MRISLCVTTRVSTTCTTTQQGRRRATGESLWCAEQSGPWGSVSASRQEYRRPQGTERISQRAGTVGVQLSHPQPAPENLHDPHNRDIDHLVEEQLGKLCGMLKSLDHGQSLCATTGISTTLTTHCSCGTCSCTTTVMSTTSKNCTWEDARPAPPPPLSLPTRHPHHPGTHFGAFGRRPRQRM